MQQFIVLPMQVIKVQACQAQEVHGQFTTKYPEFQSSRAIEMDMGISDMGILVASVYKRYSVVLFEGAVKDKTLQIVPQCSTIRGCGTNRVNSYGACL